MNESLTRGPSCNKLNRFVDLGSILGYPNSPSRTCRSFWKDMTVTFLPNRIGRRCALTNCAWLQTPSRGMDETQNLCWLIKVQHSFGIASGIRQATKSAFPLRTFGRTCHRNASKRVPGRSCVSPHPCCKEAQAKRGGSTFKRGQGSLSFRFWWL